MNTPHTPDRVVIIELMLVGEILLVLICFLYRFIWGFKEIASKPSKWLEMREIHVIVLYRTVLYILSEYAQVCFYV